MDSSLPRMLMGLAIVLAMAGLGAWGYASVTMEGRLASVRNEAIQIGYARGGRLPTTLQVREQVEGIAAAHRVELTGLEIHARNAEGLGRVASLVPQLGASLSGTMRVYEIRATGTTRALVWSLTEPVEVNLQLRSSVTAGPGGTATVRPDIHPPGVSTDIYGGTDPEDP